MMKIGNPETSCSVERLPAFDWLLQKVARLGPLTAQPGNTLLYIVMVMVIFGFLGVTMVSLFSTSTISSSTPNDARRALYLAESGARYAIAELRRTEFASATIQRFNTPTTFSMTGGGSFTVNVFGPWFDSTADRDEKKTGTVQLTVPVGRLPADFTIPAGAAIVNADYVGEQPEESTQTAQVQSFTRVDDTHLTVTVLDDDFVARRDERICLAFKPIVGAPSGSVYLPPAAKGVFPKRNGAIRVDSVDYVYTERVDDPNYSRTELTDVQRLDGGAWPGNFEVETDTYVMLSPQNYSIAPTGNAGGGSSGLVSNQAVSIFDPTLPEPGARPADWNQAEEEDLAAKWNRIETTSNYVTVDNSTKTLNLAQGTADAFGGAWYSGNLMVGGTVSYCASGECQFRYGVRLFFTLKYSGSGQGFVLALVNAADNSVASIGGDGDAPELLGYAGDSRYSGGYLDGTAAGLGLQPPKIGVEFDAQPNNFEPLYCDGSTLNTGTRDDPLSGSQDAVQYVFWGRDDSLYITCRENDVSYDDNKHNAHGSAADLENIWYHVIGGDPALLEPAIGSDGSIYVANNANQLVAVRADGTRKWTQSLGSTSAVYNPGIDPEDGTLYVDHDNFQIAAVDPVDGSMHLTSVGSDFDSTPVVGSDGSIYFGTTGSRGLRYTYDSSTGSWTFRNEYQVYGEADCRPAIGPGGQIYFVARGESALAQRGSLYAFNPATANGLGNWVWRYDILEASLWLDPSHVLSSPAVSRNGSTIYVGSNDNKLYAISSGGSLRWTRNSGGDIQSSPAVASDGTIIHGCDDGYVYAVTDYETYYSDKWRFYTGDVVVSSPAIDSNDGTIYIGSDTNRLYALNPYDGSQIWSFLTGYDIRSSPNIGPDGTIYVASNDNKLYALQAFAKPRNYKINPLESGNPESYLLTSSSPDLDADLPTPEDQENWLTRGPWAVRVEVIRSVDPNGDGNYEYTLRTWLRQCGDENCNTDNNLNQVKGTFFEDTRIEYDAREPHLLQTIELTQSEHDQFDRFLVGFTTASGPSENQSAVIGDFQLSFIRPNDPVIPSDPNWP